MIVKPENMDFSNQTFSMIIYGSPGVGKTTLALSAPDPILFDLDHGISRVSAAHRKPTAFDNTYQEFLEDIQSPAMKDFQTIVLDTGGSLVTLMKDWAWKVKGAKLKNGEFNSLKGFGYVKQEWARLTDYIKTVLNKNVIYVFHSNEQSDRDGNPIQRLVCEGSVRNTVWTPCDFGGYVQVLGGRRKICFTPQDEYFAKGCHGIQGEIEIPLLTADTKNDFITRLFDLAKENIKKENEAFEPLKESYDKAMADGKKILDGCKDVETFNAARTAFAEIKNSLTSKQELNSLWQKKAKELGLKYNRKTQKYEVNDGTVSDNKVTA